MGAFAGKRFLIVDDFPDNVEALICLLEEEDATVVGLYNPREALKVVTQSRFDVLLLDLRMPGMTGYELLKGIRALGVTTPAFALSAYSLVQETLHATDTSFARYFTKPYDIDEFLNTLREYVNAT